jgi:hypothetical protein
MVCVSALLLGIPMSSNAAGVIPVVEASRPSLSMVSPNKCNVHDCYFFNCS